MEQISIVIPAYHAEKLIGRTIESLLQEGVLANNIIVVEDGVFDNTKSVIEQYGIQHIVQPENKGGPAARNLGLSKVKTTYVMFMDSDDFVADGLIKGLVEKATLENADIVFGPWRFDGVGIKPGDIRYPSIQSNYEWVLYWLNRGMVPPCSVLWRVNSVREISGWDERLKKDQDGEIVIRALLNDFIVGASRKGHGIYWQHPSEFRVSESHISHRDFTANLIYEAISNKYSNNADEYYHLEMGKHCCKEAWNCFASNYTDKGEVWLSRAHEHGYTKKGYSLPTKILGSIFDYKYGAKIKSHLFPHFKRIVYK